MERYPVLAGWGSTVRGASDAVPAAVAPPGHGARDTRPVLPRGSVILMGFALVMIAVHFGRPFDYVLTRRHIPAAICLISLLAGAFGGGLRVLRTRIGMAVISLLGWMVLVTPFSSWKGGSAQFVVRYSFIMLSFLLPVAAAPRNLRDLKKLFYVAALVPMAMLLLVGNPEAATSAGWQVEGTSGRMELEGGTFANSADLAMVSGFTIPFWLFLCSQLWIPLVRVPLAMGGVLFLMRAIFLSGTRAGLVAGIGLFLVYFALVKTPKRLFMLVCAGIALVVIPLVLPQHLKVRFGTLFGYFSGAALENPNGEAIQSAEERRGLLIDSLRYTIRRPLTGVGPGQFPDFRWQEGVAEGVRKSWLVAHNAYTQISSECGIPAMIAFVAVFWGVIKTARTVRLSTRSSTNPDARLAAAMSLCLLGSTIFYCICGLFMSLVQYVQPVLLGSLALALERTSRLALVQPAGAAQGARLGAEEDADTYRGAGSHARAPVAGQRRSLSS